MLRSESCKEFPEVFDWSEQNSHEKRALKARSMQSFHMPKNKHLFSVNPLPVQIMEEFHYVLEISFSTKLYLHA